VNVSHLFNENSIVVEILSVVVLLVGVVVLFRGLNGGPNGAKGLLRPSAGSLGRAEGWRITVVGLTLVTLGLGGVLEARWVVFMALGFGFVEFVEASAVLAAWHRGDRRPRASQTRLLEH
jgi:hypothetical protein